MNRKYNLRRTIDSLDFSIYETVLFLDTHPNNHRAMAAFEDYKKRRATAVKEYEAAFGPYIKRFTDVTPGKRWGWIDSPWPWENEGED